MSETNRKDIIEQFFIECCKASAIYYEGQYQSVKYLCGLGKVVFVEQSRMLDYCEMLIPDYNTETDEAIIRSLMDNSAFLKGCESHEFNGCHYCLTFSLK